LKQNGRNAACALLKAAGHFAGYEFKRRGQIWVLQIIVFQFFLVQCIISFPARYKAQRNKCPGAFS
jgi:hypothetical protein